MKASLCSTVLTIVVVLLFQGCGENRVEKSASEALPAQKLVSDLQATLAQSRDNLEREKERNLELMERVQNLLEKLKETESRLPGQQTPEATLGSDPGQKKRIELMGAKALAEHRAEQFRQRIDELGRNLDTKEQELETIRQNSAKKDLEVQQLKETIEQLQVADKTRTAELNARLEQITMDLDERTVAANKFKRDLDEKTELLATLKNAVLDASKLKGNAEAEIAKLNGDLTETLRQLEGAQAQILQDRQDLMLAKNNMDQAQTDIERLRQEASRWQEETGRSQNDTEQIRQIAEAWRQQAEQFRVEVERSKQEAEQFRAEADRSRQEIVQFRVEADRAKQEVNELKGQVSDLDGQLQSLQAKLQAPDQDRPSSVDLLLEGPSAAEKKDPVFNLY